MPKYTATIAMPMATHQPAHRRTCGPLRDGAAAGSGVAGAVTGDDAAGGAWDGSDVMVLSLEVVNPVERLLVEYIRITASLLSVSADQAAHWTFPGLSMAVGAPGRRCGTHRILEPSQRDQVIVNRVEVVLLSTSERALGVRDFGGGGVADLRPRSDEPMGLLRLSHRRASAVDPAAGGNHLAVRLGHLEGNGIGDRLRLSH